MVVVMVVVGFEREAGGNWVDTTKELPKEEAACREHAAMSVNEATVYTEGDITESLAIDKEVEVVEGERLERVVRRGGHGWRERMVHI
jgi:hypothetical protein